MMKPPIITSLPVSTCMRVEMLPRRVDAATPKLRVTAGAGSKSALPAWLATIVHVPTPTRVRVVPLVPVAVHTPGVVELKVTGLPEAPPVAESVNGPSPNMRSGSGANVITWTDLVTSNA
jgi:hypothetical protein